MKLAIIGSRDFEDYAFLCRCVDGITYKNPPTLIISGGARGVDRLAENYAKEHNIPTSIHRANWSLYGNSAGMIRNRPLITESEMVLALWDLKSRGTGGALDIARGLQRPMAVFSVDGSERWWLVGPGGYPLSEDLDELINEAIKWRTHERES